MTLSHQTEHRARRGSWSRVCYLRERNKINPGASVGRDGAIIQPTQRLCLQPAPLRGVSQDVSNIPCGLSGLRPGCHQDTIAAFIYHVNIIS